MDPELNRSWKKTCNLLFGQEVGELDDYSKWLSGLIDSNIIHKSSISGKDVAFSIKEYSPKSKWISFDEVDSNKKFEPVDINKIKDIDSLVQEVSDRAYYCGNTILGNSGHVERSCNLTDCFFASDSAQYTNSKYLAFCTVGRDSSYCFGVHGPGESEFCIRCTQTVKVKRAFELWVSQNCSDCYYVYNLDGCSNCLFSFHLRNKNHCIGNLELERSKYLEIKNKLVDELAEELKKRKSLPSLLDIVKKSQVRESAPQIASLEPAAKMEKPNTIAVEKAFSDTTSVVLGKKLTKIDDYEKWLTSHSHRMVERKSALTGKKILFLPYVIALDLANELMAGRIITEEEAIALGRQLKITPAEASAITLENAHESIGKFAYFNVDFRTGDCRNLPECSVAYDASDCYKASAIVKSKYCSCGMWPKESYNCFGFDTLFDSNFCIGCYHSQKLARCFEMDNCRDCSDSMFCHNCESLSNCMFCFNVKNKRYAVGNVEIGREKYLELRKKILDEVNGKLENDRNLETSIFSLSS